MSLWDAWAARGPALPRELAGGRVVLHAGDCVETMRAMEAGSVDAVVCDPPYHLTAPSARRSNLEQAADKDLGKVNAGAFRRLAGGFMGQKWDGGDVAFRPETWAEVLRVLRPGGHLVAFSGTRTYHRMVCAIEDAGFEIRDQLAWLYGSGFPKSLDVSKAIDKAGGLSPREQSSLLRARREAAGLTREEVAQTVHCSASSVRDWEEGRARAIGRALEWITPSPEYRARLAHTLGYSADERRSIGVTVDRRDDGSVYSLGHSGIMREGGITDAAKQWDGWGTALKPAHEPIVLARKPLVGTVAENVLRHGTGALNVDGCRVGSEGATKRSHQAAYGKTEDGKEDRSQHWARTGHAVETLPLGRWPANLLHDGSDEVLAGFPQSKSTGGQASLGAFRAGKVYGAGRDEVEKRDPGYGDNGSAARFFYCAKAGAKDRVKREGAQGHPTQKPVALMRWLVRLVTPPGGTVLDPFSGTGTTGEAAVLEGMRAVLCERESDYVLDIEERMRRLKC